MNIPAFRNPWPVAIVTFFIVFSAAALLFIAFASRQRMDLVRPDYYDEEMRYQRQIDRVNRTRALTTRPGVAYDPARQIITLRWPDAGLHRPSAGRVHFYRPSDARLDREIPLRLDADGAQRVDATELRPGLWKVRVTWQMDEQDYFDDQPIVIAPPSS